MGASELFQNTINAAHLGPAKSISTGRIDMLQNKMLMHASSIDVELVDV